MAFTAGCCSGISAGAATEWGVDAAYADGPTDVETKDAIPEKKGRDQADLDHYMECSATRSPHKRPTNRKASGTISTVDTLDTVAGLDNVDTSESEDSDGVL